MPDRQIREAIVVSRGPPWAPVCFCVCFYRFSRFCVFFRDGPRGLPWAPVGPRGLPWAPVVSRGLV